MGVNSDEADTLGGGSGPYRTQGRRRFRTKPRLTYRSVAVLIVLGYLFGAAVYVTAMAWGFSAGHPFLRFEDLLAPRLNEVLIATFCFVVGASVGSFLNVVAWRLPRGQSVNGHSHCPRCHTPLVARDNVPVLGWFWLRGRCRTCRLPISPRYPVVEASVGLSFLLVGTAEIFRLNLPYQSFHAHTGPLWTPVIDAAVLITLVYHLAGLSIAWAIGLIRIDGLPLPSSLIKFSAVVLVGGLFAAPFVGVVPWQLAVPANWPMRPWWEPPPRSLAVGQGMIGQGMPLAEQWVQSAMRLVTALAAAGFYARVLGKGLCPAADLKLHPTAASAKRLLDLAAMLAVAAILVGWQAAIGVVLVAAALAWALGHWPPRLPGARFFRTSGDALGRLAIALPVALTFQLVFWSRLIGSGVWPSEQASRGALLVAVMLTLSIPAWLRQTRDANQDVTTPKEAPPAPPLRLN